MKLDLRYLITFAAVAIALAPSPGLGQSAFTNALNVPPVPSDLTVPEGNKVFLKGHAIGTQNYVCLPTASGFAWTFVAPQATLFISFPWFNGEIQQQIITHFLSPNPEEQELGRATWQHSLDTSAVWAKLFKPPSTDPDFVAPGAIPWLLLEKAGKRNGPAGGSILTSTTFIHRLNTAGGIAPSNGCSQTSNVGAVALAPYTADYFFYRKN